MLGAASGSCPGCRQVSQLTLTSPTAARGCRIGRLEIQLATGGRQTDALAPAHDVLRRFARAAGRVRHRLLRHVTAAPGPGSRDRPWSPNHDGQARGQSCCWATRTRPATGPAPARASGSIPGSPGRTARSGPRPRRGRRAPSWSTNCQAGRAHRRHWHRACDLALAAVRTAARAPTLGAGPDQLADQRHWCRRRRDRSIPLRLAEAHAQRPSGTEPLRQRHAVAAVGKRQMQQAEHRG